MIPAAIAFFKTRIGKAVAIALAVPAIFLAGSYQGAQQVRALWRAETTVINDASRAMIEREKKRNNEIILRELEHERRASQEAAQELSELRRQLGEAEAKKTAPGPYVGPGVSKVLEGLRHGTR